MATDKVDAVVVGSGAAGSLVAAKLAQAGKSVTILEAGPARTVADMTSSQIWARRLKWQAEPTTSSGADPLSVGFGSARGTGGSALHHYACWFRLHPEDFETASRFGKGLDWPISYDDLRPFYDQVQAEVGLSGDAALEVWRPQGEPYPMPPLPVFAQGELVARGFEALGKRTAPLPMAINSVEYNGRPACIQDGWCDAGCPTGALGNPLAVYLTQALKAGATLINNAPVVRVLTTPSGDRATGVAYHDDEGQLHTLEASVVVLAAYVFEIPRILLNSAEGGLANRSGAVGRYMMAHSTCNAYGLFDEETDNYLGRTGGQLMCQDDYAKDPAMGYVASSSWLIGNALKPNDLLGIANMRPELFGPALDAFLRDAALHLATMTFVGESLAEADNRVVLTGERDHNGVPLATVSHSFGPDAIACWEAGAAQGKAVMEAAGARDAWVSGRHQMHTMGGAIMGTDPETSVADGNGAAHDIPNLYLAGSSLFPTTGAVNPTFTISALAARSAAHILGAWGSLT